MEKGWRNLRTEKSVEITPALAVLIKNVFSEWTYKDSVSEVFFKAGETCARMIAPNISKQPAISLGVRACPRRIQPASTETTDSRLRIREAMVGSVPF